MAVFESRSLSFGIMAIMMAVFDSLVRGPWDAPPPQR